MNRTELVNKIDNLTQEIEELKNSIASFEYESTETEFDEYLDEANDEVCIMGMTYSPSQVLKDCDPVAYRCEKSNHDSNYDLSDCSEYTDMESELADLEEELEVLQEQLDSLDDDEG